MTSIKKILLSSIHFIILLLISYSPVTALANGWEHGAIPFSALLKALEFRDAHTRAHAAQSLGARGQLEAVAPLIQRLQTPENVPQVRNAIYRALANLGTQASVVVLEECITSEARTELRAVCIRGLGQVRAGSTASALIKRFSTDAKPIKLAVIDAFSQFDDPQSFTFLTDLISTSVSTPQSSEAQSYEIRLRAIHALGVRSDHRASPVLVKRLTQTEDLAEQTVLAQALIKLPSPGAVAPLRRALERSNDSILKAALIMALAATGAPSVRAALEPFLQHPSIELQRLAVKGLVELGDRAAYSKILARGTNLAELLLTGTASTWQNLTEVTQQQLLLLREIVNALHYLDPVRGAELFVRLARKRAIPRNSATALAVATAHYQLRRRAIYALGYTKSSLAGQLLVSQHALSDEDFRLRAVAVRSLGVLGNRKYGEAIATALNDPRAEVRWVAAQVLGHGGFTQLLAKLRPSLNDAHSEVRRQTALALAHLEDHDSAPLLRELAKNDVNEQVRRAADLSLTILADL